MATGSDEEEGDGEMEGDGDGEDDEQDKMDDKDIDDIWSHLITNNKCITNKK